MPTGAILSLSGKRRVHGKFTVQGGKPLWIFPWPGGFLSLTGTRVVNRLRHGPGPHAKGPLT